MEQLTEEFRELGEILPVLLEQNLVTEIERRKIASTIEPLERKAAIYDLIKTKRLPVAIKILKMIRRLSFPFTNCCESSFFEPSDESEEDKNIANFLETPRPVRCEETNPMLNATIVECVFGFLNLDEIKKCRMVCDAWNSVAETSLRKRAKINFRKVSPAVFIQTFESCPQVPFTAFTFRGQFSLLELEMLFSRWGTHVKSLELDSLNIINELMQTIEEFDISLWIAQSNLSHLSARCSNKCCTSLKVSLNKLISIKSLTLKGCTLNIQPKIRIAPLELYLSGVNYVIDGILLPELRINNIFDLSKANVIDVNHNGRKEATVPILDMDCDVVNAKKVNLNGGVEVNWEVCKWNVETLVISSTPFVQITPLRLKEMNCLEFTEVDLGVLPETLEKICFAFHMQIFCSLPINLPNLHSLYLHTMRMRNSSVLSYFKACENLVNICIHGHNSRSSVDLELCFDSIPKSVKKIKLGGDTIKIVGNGKLEVDTLILEGYCSEDAEEIVDKIKPTLLAIEWVQKYDKIDSISMFVLDNQHNIETIVVGSWEFKSRVFKRSRLSNYVDKKANYYIFQKNYGKALTRKKFDEFMDI